MATRQPAASGDPLHLVDASIYIFRAWFSIPDSMQDPEGRSVNALYGFARFLGELLTAAKPKHIAIAFDESLTSSYRNEIYPEYKANRDPAPEELKHQFALCREVAMAMGLATYSSNRYEADDIIGSVADWWRGKQGRTVVVTRDKDLAQLLKPGDEYWDFAGKRRLQYDGIKDFFGVHPEQIADFLALTGDSVDNIPGVPGIGAKTATRLLEVFPDLDSIYSDLERVGEMKIRGAARIAAALSENKDAAYLAQRLTRIACDMDLKLDTQQLERDQLDLDGLNKFYDRLGFGDALRVQARRLAREFNEA